MTLPPRPRTGRWRWIVGAGAVVVWAVLRAGIEGDIVNTDGWPAFRRFWGAILDPELSWDFVRLAVESAGVTLGFAVLGTVLSVVIGLAGGVLVSRRFWSPDEPAGPTRRRLLYGGWGAARLVMVVPRAVHEVLWGLLLVQVLGFDPMVAVLAIGLPFGAVTARVFADLIDEADDRPFALLRASGAGRLAALTYGVLPLARPDLVSYAFYRFECAMRSAAILGIIGAGGLGFQLDLSFQTLEYHEIWTFIFALMVLSGAADLWSSTVRHRLGRSDVVVHVHADTARGAGVAAGARRRDPVITASWIGLAVLVPLSWRWVGLDPTTLWSERTRRLAGDLVGDLLPPRAGPGGLAGLWGSALDTLSMSIIAIVIAAGAAVLVAFAASSGRGPRRWVAGPARLLLLLCRAVPPPVWAFLFVLILFPGTWPGAVALGVYNFGVLGRLMYEIVDNHDDRTTRMLVAQGATGGGAFLYATFPGVAGRFAGVSLYRWEVALRETVIVGVVGASGLGRLFAEDLAARDFQAVSGVVLALVALTVVVDFASERVRRRIR
jgi:phosphonate transport system permease protein